MCLRIWDFLILKPKRVVLKADLAFEIYNLIDQITPAADREVHQRVVAV